MVAVRRLVVFVAVALAVSTIASGRAQQRSPAGSTGLMPVYDGSGLDYGDTFARFATASLFRELTLGGRDVTMLNPGALYSPLDESAAVDFARAAGVDIAIISTLKPPFRDRPKDDRPEVLIETVVINTVDGTKSRQLTWREEVKQRDLERGFEGGAGGTLRGLQGSGERYANASYVSYADPSRALNKQPLGKAVLAIAAGLRGLVIQSLPSGVALPQFPAGSCEIEFGVAYTSRKAVSRIYSVVVNGREESLSVLDGIVKLNLQTGKVLIELSLGDAPFRLPVQPVYVANTVNDCTRRRLTLDLGSAGEALLVWR